MIVAQLTDLHIKKDGKIAYKTVDTLACLNKAIKHINSLIPKPDCVVITGDLGDFGIDEEYSLIYSALKKLTMPIYIIPGNHDHRDNLRQKLGDLTQFSHDSYCHFMADYQDQLLIGLDTSVLGKPHGYLSDESLAWLEASLKENSDKPTLIFMHHPPMHVGLKHMDVQNLLNADALYEVVKNYKQVNGFVTGHLHRPITALWNSIPVWVGPSHSHSVALDLLPDAPSAFVLDPGAIQLFMLDGKSVVSHISYIDGESEIYPFFDSNGALID